VVSQDALAVISVQTIQYSSDGRFFANGKITAARKTYATRKFDRVGKRTGKHVHPHQLRDTFAIELLLSGVPVSHLSHFGAI
jgi:integrase